MDTSSIIMPVAIVMAVALLWWRLKASGAGTSASKGTAYALLKARENGASTASAGFQSAVNAPEKAPSETTIPPDAPVTDLELPDALASLQLIDYPTFQAQRQTDKDFKSLRKPHPLLMSLSKDITDSHELIDIVKSDPELVAKVLNMANSPVFGLSKAITDINHAIIYLGIAQVKNLATAFAISQSFTFESEAQQAAYNKIWKTSFLASALALFVAREANLDNPSELSTSCLLSYLGDITLLSIDARAADHYLNAMPLHLRIKATQDTYHSNAAVMGGLFCQHIELPKALYQGIGFGYQPLLNQWDDSSVSPEQKQSILFCYSLCRVAEFAILEADTEYAHTPDLSYSFAHKPELFHLQAQLEVAGLGHLNALLVNPRTKGKLAQMLSDLNQNA